MPKFPERMFLQNERDDDYPPSYLAESRLDDLALSDEPVEVGVYTLVKTVRVSKVVKVEAAG